MTKSEKMEVEKIAGEIRKRDTWDDDLNFALCKLAGLEEEYLETDAEAFENVVLKAAEILQVEIF